MIEQLISRVFYARNVAHWHHWRTKSYAQHVALGSFYDGVIDALDALVEAKQGADDLVGDIPTPKNQQGSVVETLRADAEWIEKNHEDICGGNRALGNLLDNITGLYLSTIYKLENLK